MLRKEITLKNVAMDQEMDNDDDNPSSSKFYGHNLSKQVLIGLVKLILTKRQIQIQ
jgi:hypothetical protein